MILYGDRHIIAQQVQGAEFFVVKQGIALAAAERHHSHKLAADFQWSDALEELRSHISVRAQEDVIGARSQDDRSTGRGQGVNMLRQQWHDRGLGHQGEALGGNRGEHGRLVAEGEKHAFASAGSLQQRRDHGPGGLRKLPLGRYFRAKIGQSFHGSQQPPQIIFLHSHARMRAKHQSKKKSNMRRNRGISKVVG